MGDHIGILTDDLFSFFDTFCIVLVSTTRVCPPLPPPTSFVLATELSFASNFVLFLPPSLYPLVLQCTTTLIKTRPTVQAKTPALRESSSVWSAHNSTCLSHQCGTVQYTGTLFCVRIHSKLQTEQRVGWHQQGINNGCRAHTGATWNGVGTSDGLCAGMCCAVECLLLVMSCSVCRLASVRPEFRRFIKPKTRR